MIPFIEDLGAESVDEFLARDDIPADVRRVLEIRSLISSASVKKLQAIDRFACSDSRLRNMFIHHGARTGRPTGADVQLLNLPKAGPDLKQCKLCDNPSKNSAPNCLWCGVPFAPNTVGEWSAHMVPKVMDVIACRDLDLIEHYFGDAIATVKGCVRGTLVAADGYDLIASDYTAIEAVVNAVLAGEQWRIDAFKAKLPIYLMSASKITGTPLETYVKYKDDTGKHHPDRQNIGKVAELALGYGGWIGAWLNFDKSGRFTERQIKDIIIAWRNASPAIVELWGGQFRGLPWDPNRRQEYFGLEGAFCQAILCPGLYFATHQARLWVDPKTDVLNFQLPSGRILKYHSPRAVPSMRRQGELELSYMTWNTNPKYGPVGWIRMTTYGPKLTENYVQAVSHDIQRASMKAQEDAGYKIVLHVYDENVAEVPKGWGSVEEFEHIMRESKPAWAADWPIDVGGGWRGKRYRKD